MQQNILQHDQRRVRLVTVALIGHGYWGKILEKYLTLENGFKLVHICDSKSNMDSVWPDIKAVVVATPIETHYSIVKEALSHEKHVLSEKPLALEVKQCLELKELAKKNNVALQVEYTQSFSRSLLKAVKIDIGKIQSIDMRVRHLGKFLKHDVYWLLASHCLSILDIFVPLKSLNFKRTDLVKTGKRTETGTIIFNNHSLKGQISLSLNYPGKDYQVVVYGSQGTIVYDTQARPVLKTVWYDKKENLIATDLDNREEKYDFDEANNVRLAVKCFYQVIAGRERSNIDRAIEITRVIEKLKR